MYKIQDKIQNTAVAEGWLSKGCWLQKYKDSQKHKYTSKKVHKHANLEATQVGKYSSLIINNLQV